jgi:hypothetical protein
LPPPLDAEAMMMTSSAPARPQGQILRFRQIDAIAA